MPKPAAAIATEQIYEDLEPLTEEDEVNGWHLAIFLDAIMSVLIEDVRAWVEDREKMPGWAVLLNVDEAPPEGLPWLAQFIGAVFSGGMTEAEQREEIKTPNNFVRGRPETIEKSAQRTLTGTKTVVFKERFGFGANHAYRLFVRTFDAETPDEDVVREDILKQKPGGIRLDYESIAGQMYFQLPPKFETYDDLKEAYTDYNEAKSDF